MSQTEIKAQTDGFISNVFLQKGNYMTPGQSMFALVRSSATRLVFLQKGNYMTPGHDTEQWWVIANFRETVLRRLHVHDKVEVYLDMYPGQTFQGQIESISWGVNRREASSNVVNSSLAYLKTTEDWIRIAQRFPVRIRLKNAPGRYSLRVGASARVKVIASSSS